MTCGLSHSKTFYTAYYLLLQIIHLSKIQIGNEEMSKLH